MSDSLPLLLPADPQRALAWRKGARVALAEFGRHVAAIAAELPATGFMINLCEDRYHFLAAYAAALSAGHPVLLPPARVELVVAELEAANSGSYRFDDAAVAAAFERADSSARAVLEARIPADQTVMIGCTSGSTGQPKTYPKSWRTVNGSNFHNAAAIRAALGTDQHTTPWILATVPPQHMYGMELSVLLPLAGGMAVHAGRPLFPADIAVALAMLPRPRVLVSTPVHLRAMVESSQEFPATDLIVSATAPLDRALAAAVEKRLGGQLLEMFGSTETCVFASRYTAREDLWRLYDGVRLESSAAGTVVHAPWFSAPVPLQDVLELSGPDRFAVRGRNSDLIEVAGKRASLADLTRRLLAVAGVQDAVVFQPELDTVGAAHRVAALVVAPGSTARQILDRLAPAVDPAFLPRPLLIVERLPRNELGKLPREQLLRALRRR